MYNDHVATCMTVHVVVLLPPSCAMVERLLNLRNFQRHCVCVQCGLYIVYSTKHVEYVVASNKDWLNMVAVLFSIKKRRANIVLAKFLFAQLFCEKFSPKTFCQNSRRFRSL